MHGLVSTLSWGILYDSPFYYATAKNFSQCFNPLLRNSLWFLSLTVSASSTNDTYVSTLSWGILYDSSIKERGILQPLYLSFNPLLRNSLWFYTTNTCNRCLLRKKFQPSLEEFFMIQYPEKLFILVERRSFNPLLRNSLWFLVEKILVEVGLWKWFQPSLEEFFMILIIPKAIRRTLNLQPFQPSLEEFFMIQL